MTIKLEAAYHEAGHAITAHRSRFHNLIGTIDLGQYGSGEIYVSLSRSKVKAAGKTLSSSLPKDKEVVTDLAVVLCAGLVAEQLAAEENSDLTPNPLCSEPDHELLKQQLFGANLQFELSGYEACARDILTKNWGLVKALSDYLYTNKSVDTIDVVDFIDGF